MTARAAAILSSLTWKTALDFLIAKQKISPTVPLKGTAVFDGHQNILAAIGEIAEPAHRLSLVDVQNLHNNNGAIGKDPLFLVCFVGIWINVNLMNTGKNGLVAILIVRYHG